MEHYTHWCCEVKVDTVTVCWHKGRLSNQVRAELKRHAKQVNERPCPMRNGEGNRYQYVIQEPDPHALGILRSGSRPGSCGKS
jgi:hypothetical protein